MYKTQAKEITRLQLTGLLVGTGLAASIQFGILYFFAGLIFEFFIPGLSRKGGFWLTIPWIVRTFFVTFRFFRRSNQVVTTDELLKTARPSHHADQMLFQIPLP